ncbi:hypothetical protein ACFWAP_03870 [Streptomyces goshikiensis]|uniref:hypothetical protein n=1 Tax=Streptomyces goshikiensis TaxID=1942 RepID=UPI00365C8D3E
MTPTTDPAPPDPGQDDHLAQLLAAVCEQDRADSPFGRSEPAQAVPVPGHPYGDPLRWAKVPAPLTAAVVAALTGHGWTGVHATAHSIVVALDDRACGLETAAARGEHLYVMWGVPRPEWSWGTSRPDASAGGRLALLLAPPDDPGEITLQILRVLATGRALP